MLRESIYIAVILIYLFIYSPSKRSRNEINNRNPVFMEGVSGVTAIFDQPRLSNIQRRTQDLCKWKR